MNKFFSDCKNNIWFWVFLAACITFLILFPTLSSTAGNSGDEDGFQIPQGKNIINYFKTEGADTTCMDFKNLKYYGSSFDVIAEFIDQNFHIDNISQTRHSLNALCGWLSIVMVGLLAYLVGGWRGAVFSIILLFFSPRYLGHSFNNPKDIPFATAIISSIFGMTLFFKQFPKVKWYTFIIFCLSIAFAISVRIGGLIIFGFLGFFGLLFLIKLKKQTKTITTLSKNGKAKDSSFGKLFFKMAFMGLAICVIGYFLGLLIWPYALEAPIKNPIEAFKAMSTFDTSLRQLFEGTLQWSDALPWYYTPKYILMTIPIAVIVGLVLFFVFCWRKKEDRFWAFVVFFTFFFPVFWIVYTHANVYGGWRHAMFAYPPMVVAAGWGFDALLKWVEEKWMVENKEMRTEICD